MQLKTVEERVQTLHERTSYFLAGFYRSWKRMKEVVEDHEIEERAGYDAMMFSSELRHALTQDRQDTIAAVIEMVEGMKITAMVGIGLDLDERAYNQAIDDIITKLQALSPKE